MPPKKTYHTFFKSLFMPKKKSDSTFDLPAIERKIKKAMIEQGTYSKSMDITISLAAGAYYTYKLAIDSITGGRVVKTELTREKHKKYIITPEYYIMVTSAELTRKYLRELRLTRATIEGDSEEDELTEMVKNVSAIKNGKPSKFKKMIGDD